MRPPKKYDMPIVRADIYSRDLGTSSRIGITSDSVAVDRRHTPMLSPNFRMKGVIPLSGIVILLR
jgi:hypothetical protein